MSSESTDPASRTAENPLGADCELDPRSQRRNALIYAAQISLFYLAAPALYVGFVQAGLCKRLHTSDAIANLPSTIYLAMAWVPIVVTWLFPQARLLKKLLSGACCLMAAAGVFVSVVLITATSTALIVTALVAHAAILGAANGVVNILGWEALDRGVSSTLRGKALGLAFGWGPVFAVVGSLGAQLVLDGKVLGWTSPRWLAIGYPYDYCVIFGASAVCMLAAGYLVRYYRIPVPREDARREQFRDGIIGGARSFCRNRVLLFASLAYLLVYCGNMVQTNMSLFSYQAVGQMSENLVGYQLTLRFSFKIAMGFFLGWVLTRTNPKVPLLVTAGLQILGVLWVLFVPGYWFMLAFGINGAGELFGVYYMNYPVQCSAKADVRRNIAFLTLLSAFVGLSPVLYGAIADSWGLRASFWSALVLLIATIAMVARKLPRTPRPPDERGMNIDPAVV